MLLREKKKKVEDQFTLSVSPFAALQHSALSTVDPLASVVTGSHAGSQLIQFWVDWKMDPTTFTLPFIFGLGSGIAILNIILSWMLFIICIW